MVRQEYETGNVFCPEMKVVNLILELKTPRACFMTSASTGEFGEHK